MSKKVAYSVLSITKSVDDGESREIYGIATTPAPDREGDVIDSTGIQYAESLPLLLHHDHKSPVGTVEFYEKTEAGIKFKAKIAKIEEEGALKTRTDEAWQSVKSGIIKGVSIGFRVIDGAIEVMKSGGIHFKSIEVYELSLVTVPANAQATILALKSYDSNSDDDVESESPATTVSQTIINNNDIVKNHNNKGKENFMKISDQIKSYETKIVALKKQLEEVFEKSLAESRELDEEEEGRYASIKEEITNSEKHLGRLKDFEKTISKEENTVEVAEQNESVKSFSMPAQPKKFVEKGVKFARFAKAVRGAKGDLRTAAEHAKKFTDTPEVYNAIKAMVDSGTTTNADYSALTDYQNIQSDFIEFLRPRTIIGQLDGFRFAPFNVRIKGQNQGSVAQFVGEAKMKPVTSLGFNSILLEEYKLAALVTVSDELLRNADPRIDLTIRDDLANAIAQAVDLQFINPLADGVEGVSPASVTNGVTAIPASGVTADDLRRDLTKLKINMSNAKIGYGGAYIVLDTAIRLQIENMRTALGSAEFPELADSRLMGLPVVESENVGNNIVLVKTNEIYMNQDNIVIDTSREASVLMSNDPNNDSGSLVSLWQTNQQGFLAEQYVNWQKRRDAAVQYISGANYGGLETGE